MKRILVTNILLSLALFVFGQTKNGEGYIPLHNDPKTASYYQAGNNTYLDYFDKTMASFEGNDYYVRIRTYSWGKRDTSYYREDNEYYYHFDPDNGTESIVLPKQITVNQMWYEADSSWSYKVIGIDETIKTPAKKYKELIIIECEQLTRRDKNKDKVYHLYYAKDVGLVASVNFGKISSYLSEIKAAKKDGDKIGK